MHSDKGARTEVLARVEGMKFRTNVTQSPHSITENWNALLKCRMYSFSFTLEPGVTEHRAAVAPANSRHKSSPSKRATPRVSGKILVTQSPDIAATPFLI